MSIYDPSGGIGSGELPSGGWRTAQRSGPNGGDCVEVNLHVPWVVGVRDSKLRADGLLRFAPGKWRTFIQAALDGRLDR